MSAACASSTCRRRGERCRRRPSTSCPTSRPIASTACSTPPSRPSTSSPRSGAPIPAGEEVHIVSGPLRIQLAQALPGVDPRLGPALRHLSAAALPQVPRVRARARHLRELDRAPHLVHRRARRRSRLGARRRRLLPRRSLHAALVSQGRVRARDPGVGQLHPGDRSRDVRAAGAVRLVVLLHARGSRSVARQPRAVQRHAPDGQDRSTPSCAIFSARKRGRSSSPARSSAARRCGRRRRRSAAQSLDWFWKQWLGPYPNGRLSLRRRHHRAARQARPGARARVIKLGAHRAGRAGRGARHRSARATSRTETWDGVGREHTYVFDMTAALSARSRSIRAAGSSRSCPARSDDLEVRRPQTAALEVHLQQLRRPSALLPDAGARPVARLLAGAHPRSAPRAALRRLSLGGDRGRRHRARTRTASGARSRPRASSSALRPVARRLRASIPSFAQAIGAGANPGTLLTASVSWGYDDRLFVWEPMRALSLGAALAVDETVLDNGAVLSQGVASARLGVDPRARRRPRAGHDRRRRRHLRRPQDSRARCSRSAAPAALRGYDVASLLGRWYVFGRAEWRHIYTHELDVNLLHSLYVRGIGGGLFAEAGVVSQCESYSPDAQELRRRRRLHGAHLRRLVRRLADDAQHRLRRAAGDATIAPASVIAGGEEQRALRLLLQLRSALVIDGRDSLMISSPR